MIPTTTFLDFKKKKVQKINNFSSKLTKKYMLLLYCRRNKYLGQQVILHHFLCPIPIDQNIELMHHMLTSGMSVFFFFKEKKSLYNSDDEMI
jgi:hypothetical protein